MESIPHALRFGMNFHKIDRSQQRKTDCIDENWLQLLTTSPLWPDLSPNRAAGALTCQKSCRIPSECSRLFPSQLQATWRKSRSDKKRPFASPAAAKEGPVFQESPQISEHYFTERRVAYCSKITHARQSAEGIFQNILLKNFQPKTQEGDALKLKDCNILESSPFSTS